jgi:hypothetical protein
MLQAKGSKVKYDESENYGNKSENDSDDDDDEFSNEQLMNMLEQADSIIKKRTRSAKNYKRSLMPLSNPLMRSILLMRG